MRVVSIGMGWFPETPGGLNRVFFDLHRTLPGCGVRSLGVVVGRPGASQVPADVILAGHTEMTLPRRAWALRQAVQQALRAAPPSDPLVIAGHFALHVAPALDLIDDHPFVVHFHGPWADESRAEGEREVVVAIKRKIEQVVYRRADLFIVLSRAFGDILHKTYGVPWDQIRIIPGTIDADRFAMPISRQEARARLGWPADAPAIVTVRRLVRRMGLERLIDAMVIVRGSVPNARLYIAGAGNLRPEIEERIARRGLERTVSLLGYVKDEQLPEVYRAADLSIVPSLTLEGFGLTTIESLAAGTPVLVTPVGGLPEVVRDLSPSLVVQNTEPAALADGIIQALSGQLPLPSEHECRSYAQERYNAPVIAAQVSTVYAETLARARKAQ